MKKWKKPKSTEFLRQIEALVAETEKSASDVIERETTKIMALKKIIELKRQESENG